MWDELFGVAVFVVLFLGGLFLYDVGVAISVLADETFT